MGKIHLFEHLHFFFPLTNITIIIYIQKIQPFNVMNKINFALTTLMICICVCVCLVIPEMISAQPSFPDDPDQIPIDGGLALLTAAGASYAIKKFNNTRKNTDS